VYIETYGEEVKIGEKLRVYIGQCKIGGGGVLLRV